MLNNAIRILNFDNSILKQKNLISNYESEIIDLEKIGPKARLWANGKVRRYIRERIRGSRKNCITFLGSGDFHHCSSLLLEEIQEPFCLIVFDYHPDWDIMPPSLGCGSWVTRSLKNKNLLKAVLLGNASQDLSEYCLQSANLASLKDNRVEIYPYFHKPTKVWFRNLPNNKSINVKRGFFYYKISWSQLVERNLAAFCGELIKFLPAKKAYISIDKDCLKKEYALTNWEEGKMSLDELIGMLKVLKENLDIIGVDITGDYSECLVSGFIKKVVSGLDHPKNYSAQGLEEPYITTVNEATNLEILEALKNN